MSKDISIEYAHIYTNHKIDEEHKTSLDILNGLRADLEGKSTSLVVMVDDYSFPDPTFDYDEFSGWLNEHGFKPDVVFRESQLIPVCDEVLGLIENQKLKGEIVDYIKAKKYPCSLFIAAWYLLRLGKVSYPAFSNELAADKLINILPESFKPFEDKGLEIIASTRFADAVDAIEYKFFPGRLIA
ncbi:MAG: hypothetical protein WDN27_02190 [Candidatus Saccharibacteria bacterium]